MPHATHWTRCTAQRMDGSFCDAPSVNGAPFPICLSHASELLAFVTDALGGGSELDRVRRLATGWSPSEADLDRAYRKRRADVVYYVQLGDMIKIGTSSHLADRVRAYPPHAVLLASEPGSAELEAQRHREFNEYLASGREWFTLGPRLAEHITSLK